MNGIEQKTHKRVTDELAAGLEDLSRASTERATAISASVEELANVTRELINKERTHRLSLASEQRAYVDRADTFNRDILNAFVGRTFWSRLNWIMTGR